MERHTALMKVLADPTRLKLFKLLLHRELCVCQLQGLLHISQPAVSQHIARLREAGLLRERRSGSWTYYQGDFNRVAAGLGELLTFLASDPSGTAELSEMLNLAAEMDPGELCRTPVRSAGERGSARLPKEVSLK